MDSSTRGATVRGRWLLGSSLALALIVAPFAGAAGEGTNARLGTRNPAGGTSPTAETQTIAQNRSYGTRQSNLTVGDGGGAIYGCRSSASNEPCLRAANLRPL